MLYTMYMLRDSIARITGLNAQMKEDTKVEFLVSYREKFYNFAYDICLMLLEASVHMNNRTLSNKYYTVKNAISDAIKAKTIIELKEVITKITDEFKEFDYSDFNTNNFNSVIQDYRYKIRCNLPYEIENKDNVIIKGIFQAIKNDSNDRNITMFYPACSDGENIETVKTVFENNNLKIYGIEPNDYKLTIAKRKFTRVVKGELRGARIQNNAFDILYVEPNILLDVNQNNPYSIKKIEKDRISEMFKYLRTDGIMIICMPHTRLWRDTSSMLSKYLKNINIYKIDGKDFDDAGMIYIVGKKDVNTEPRQEEYSKLRKLYDINNVKSFTYDIEEGIYKLPKQYIDIEIFKGSQLDIEEIDDILLKSNLMTQYFEKQRAEKLNEITKNPLLPFNIGQLGLVLTSGCLDGIVEEDADHCHLIKGRVSKQVITSEDDEEDEDTSDEMELVETTVNKVEINVLLPNGEFKTLA